MSVCISCGSRLSSGTNASVKSASVQFCESCNVKRGADNFRANWEIEPVSKNLQEVTSVPSLITACQSGNYETMKHPVINAVKMTAKYSWMTVMGVFWSMIALALLLVVFHVATAIHNSACGYQTALSENC